METRHSLPCRESWQQAYPMDVDSGINLPDFLIQAAAQLVI